MTNYDNQEEECDCLSCSLTEEFRLMIKEGVDWESALRHIIDVMTSEVKEADENLSDLIDETFVDGYSQGVLDGVEKSQSILLALSEDTDVQIAKIRDSYGLDAPVDEDIDDEPVEKLEDLSDEQFDEIQTIIKRNL